MKKIIQLCIILYSSFIVSQVNNVNSTDFIKTENSKSGNYKDIFNSFFQLASENYNINEKSIKINSTLFGIKSKMDPELLLDKNIQKESFSRNFQFNVKLDLNDDYKYQGFTGGFTYAIVNGRDKQLAILTNTKYGDLHQKYAKILDAIFIEMKKDVNTENISDDEKTTKKDLIESELENIKNNKEPIDATIYNVIITKFNQKSVTLNDVNNKDLKSFTKHLKNLKNKEYEKIDAKPLWTIAADGSSNIDSKFNKASLSSIFLMGNSKATKEIDIRAKFIYADTLEVTHLPRALFNAKAGVNFKLAKNNNLQSFFEIKAYLEYNHLFHNLVLDEKKNDLFVNADFRIRLMDDLWIPLTVRYDATNKGNFYGFLNVSYNFGGLKQNIK